MMGQQSSDLRYIFQKVCKHHLFSSVSALPKVQVLRLSLAVCLSMSMHMVHHVSRTFSKKYSKKMSPQLISTASPFNELPPFFLLLTHEGSFQNFPEKVSWATLPKRAFTITGQFQSQMMLCAIRAFIIEKCTIFTIKQFSCPPCQKKVEQKLEANAMSSLLPFGHDREVGEWGRKECSQALQSRELIINWSIIMRFYQNSTVRQGGQSQRHVDDASSRAKAFTPVQNTNPSPAFLFYFNQYCAEFLEVSNFLNQELLKNNNLITSRVVQKPEPSIPQKDNKKDSEDNSTASRKNPSQFNQDRIEPIAQRSSLLERRSSKKKRAYLSDSEESYKPDQEYSKDINGSKVSQSKNIPKNYGKAILTFIRKNEDFTLKVLERLGIDSDEFFEALKELRYNLNTISQLRSIWIDEENRYAKAYRILSLEYLRKHSLSYIFNSRVQNFHKHIKYRYKIIKSVSDPLDFTCMKEF